MTCIRDPDPSVFEIGAAMLRQIFHHQFVPTTCSISYCRFGFPSRLHIVSLSWLNERISLVLLQIRVRVSTRVGDGSDYDKANFLPGSSKVPRFRSCNL